jgi:hypothetical protein
MNVVFRTLLCQRLRKTNHRQLSRGIIRLTEASKQTRSTGSIDNSSELLFPEMRPSSSCALIRPLNMYRDDQIPILIRHILERNITENTSIVEQDVDTTVVLDSCFDDLLAIGDTVVVGYCFAACGFDLVDDYICGLSGMMLVTSLRNVMLCWDCFDDG